MAQLLWLLSLLTVSVSACAQSGPAPVVTGNQRVDKLLSQMTLEEKISLIHGTMEDSANSQGEAGFLAGIPRLGIPSLRMSDGPPGVLTRLPSQAETATMGVAATFSAEDAEQNGIVIAREARSLGIDLVLEPFINIDRDITFTRGYNTFGEDPVLTGVIGAAEIKGIQSLGIMAQAKHYVAYDSAADRVIVDPQTLHEIYIAPFKDAVDAKVSSIMCAYDIINGARNCGNDDTLNGILRKELGFKGFVTSDWGATHAPTFINDGLDLEMPGTLPRNSPMAGRMFSFFNYEKVEPAPAPPPSAATLAFDPLRSGSMPEEPPSTRGGGGSRNANDQKINLWDSIHSGQVNEDTVTRAAGRILYEYDKFGFLDRKPQHNILAHDTEANARIIQKTAEDAAVLLKNEGAVLPLKSADLASLAMIGPGAGQIVAIGVAGERSVGFPWRQVGPVDAIKKLMPPDKAANIRWAVADDMTGTPIPTSALSHDGQQGLLRTDESGTPQGPLLASAVSTIVDSAVNFTLAGKNALPANSKVTWRGDLDIPSNGDYEINLQMLGAAALLKIDGKNFSGIAPGPGNLHGDTIQANQHNLLPTPDGLDNIRRLVQLSAGKHALELSLIGDSSNSPEQIRLNWVTPVERQKNYDEAIAAAKASKTAIVFAWSRGNPTFGLPGDQDKLIGEIASVNPNTIVVLNVSQPVAMPWLGQVKAVLQMWWPGDEGGPATANILLGKSSPAGRLPFTWARNLQDYCCSSNSAHPERTAAGTDGQTVYTEGIYVGYRWFDRQKIDPLFPFGFGLSYGKFDYSDLKIRSSADGGLDLSFKVKNSSTIASDEVPQVYLGPPATQPAGISFATRALAGFTRVHLQPGQLQTVEIHVPLRRLQYWSETEERWQTPLGARQVMVGRSSRDLPLIAPSTEK